MKKFLLYLIFGVFVIHGPNGTEIGIYDTDTNTVISHDDTGTKIGTYYPDTGIYHGTSEKGSSTGVLLDDPVEHMRRSRQRLDSMLGD